MSDVALGTANGASATRLDCQRVAEAIQRGAAWLARQQAADGSIERDLGIGPTTRHRGHWRSPAGVPKRSDSCPGCGARRSRRTATLGVSATQPRRRLPVPQRLGRGRGAQAGPLRPRQPRHALHPELPGPGDRRVLFGPGATGQAGNLVTCMCGLAALWGGYLAEAGRVAGYLRTMLDAQPDVERRFSPPTSPEAA